MNFHFTHVLFSAMSMMALTSISAVTYGQLGAKGLFDGDEPLTLSLRGGVRELLRDRSPDSKWHQLTLLYNEVGGHEVTMQVEVKTRGHFRKLKENCSLPPLMIHFTKDSQKSSSLFSDQFALKLILPCADDEYIVREWLVYKLYNLITPRSFKARLVKIKLEDARNRKPADFLSGILLEEEQQMSARNNMISIDKRLQPQQTHTDAFHLMAVFEYLVGNTDWSVQFLQNVKLMAKDSFAAPVPVPYDFDHSGLVRAPYAHPPEALQLSSTRERRYRGYCITNLKTFERVIDVFNEVKKDLYNLYRTCKLLDAKYVSYVIQYFDEFYKTINESKAWKKEFSYPCDKSGTGNVVIKGLKQD